MLHSWMIYPPPPPDPSRGSRYADPRTLIMQDALLVTIHTLSAGARAAIRILFTSTDSSNCLLEKLAVTAICLCRAGNYSRIHAASGVLTSIVPVLYQCTNLSPLFDIEIP